MEKRTAPDNHMIWAILCTLFCCLPLGIISIINAAKVDSLYRTGDYEGAYKAAEDAKKYALWGAIPAAIIVVIYIIVGILAAII
jgi:hypothetical protein